MPRLHDLRRHSALLAWAQRVKRASDASTDELYGGSNPFSSTPCVESCCGLLEAMDRHKLGKECCRELLRNGVFRTLGEGTAADWDGICRRLAQRVEPQAQQPAWPQQDPQDFCTDRLKRASCSSEVAVFMLRLVVRAACLGSSWYGPWDSMEAVQQLIKADAWSSLLDALVAMLDTFRSDLDKQYNAINIVSDILHIFYSLSEWHTHVDFRPSHVEHTGLPEAAVEVLYLVMKYAATLPCLQRDQASCADTALLMVDLSYQSPS